VLQTKLKLIVNFLVIQVRELIEIESSNEIIIQVGELIKTKSFNEIIQKNKFCLTLM
jgi:hypothetical protein